MQRRERGGGREPPAARLLTALPRRRCDGGCRAMRALRARGGMGGAAGVMDSGDDTDQEFDVPEHPPPPFELELLEAALMVATSALPIHL